VYRAAESQMAGGERDATPFLDRQLPLPQPPSSSTISIPAAIIVIRASSTCCR